MTAVAPPFQPVMVPSSAEKMKLALVPLGSRKAVPALKTWPVGVPFLPPAPGTVTTRGVIAPEPLYRVDVPVPVFELQKGLVPLMGTPQGLTTLGAGTSATPGWSATRSWRT